MCAIQQFDIVYFPWSHIRVLSMKSHTNFGRRPKSCYHTQNVAERENCVVVTYRPLMLSWQQGLPSERRIIF